jgi:hypothetical protein
MFIQEHFFSNPGQIALVIDPLAETEGVFYWKKGKVVAGDYFWVGSKMNVSRPEDADPSQHPKTKRHGASGDDAGSDRQASEAPLFSGPWFSVLGIVMLCMLMYILGGFMKQDKFDLEARVLEGAIFDYCHMTGRRPGLETFLVPAEQRVQDSLAEIKRLTEGKQASDDKGNKKKAPKEELIAPERLAKLKARLLYLQKELGNIRSLYCLSAREKENLYKLIGIQLYTELGLDKVPPESTPKKDPKKNPKQTDGKKSPKKDPSKKDPK